MVNAMPFTILEFFSNRKGSDSNGVCQCEIMYEFSQLLTHTALYRSRMDVNYLVSKKKPRK